MYNAVVPDIADLGALQRGGGTNPTELLNLCLSRIDEANDIINAVIALDRSNAERAAIESADRWRRRAALSPIDGAPILVKANIAVAGMPWHAGIAAYGDRVAEIDAAVVGRLRAAGAVILGLTNMDEGALGATGNNQWLGRIRNPNRPSFSTGGSSGGSAAAVAAGFCLAALGSDTIGSVAIPAAYCNIVGHRGSRDLIPVDGIVPLSRSFDHGGFHTATVRGATALGRALGCSGPHTGPFRIAAITMDIPELDAGVETVLARATKLALSIGWTVDNVILPVAVGEIGRRMFELAEAEGGQVHQQMLNDRPAGFSPEFRRMLDWGLGKGADRRAAHLAELGHAAVRVCKALANFDALLLPATPHAGFSAGSTPPADQALFAALPACLGWSATTIPAMNGAKLALMVTAPSDDVCLAIAAGFST